jgi:hypothetical protein
MNRGDAPSESEGMLTIPAIVERLKSFLPAVSDQPWIKKAIEGAIERLSDRTVPEPEESVECVACEDRPKYPNNPCAVCGRSTALSESPQPGAKGQL